MIRISRQLLTTDGITFAQSNVGQEVCILSLLLYHEHVFVTLIACLSNLSSGFADIIWGKGGGGGGGGAGRKKEKEMDNHLFFSKHSFTIVHCFLA